MKVHKPNASVRIRAGGSRETYDKDAALAGPGFDPDGKKKKAGMYSLDFLIVEKKDSKGDWISHPAFSHLKRPQRIEIELVSNIPTFTLQVHRGAYNSGKAWCSRPHCVTDDIGLAQRRTDGGGIYITECNPQKCTLALHGEHGGYEKEIYDRWNKVYPAEPPLAKRDGQKIEAVKCMPLVNLIFALPDPQNPEDYCHSESDYALFFTRSRVMRDRFREAIGMLISRCHGEITGIRMTLEYEPIKTGHSKAKKDGWKLKLPNDADLEKQRIKASERRRLQRIQYDMLPANVSSTALMKVSEERNLVEWVAEHYPEALNTQLVDNARHQEMQFEELRADDYYLVNQDPTVQELIRRTNTSYALETRLPQDFKDSFSVVEWYKNARKPSQYIDDILYRFYSALPGRHPFVAEMDAQADERRFTSPPDMYVPPVQPDHLTKDIPGAAGPEVSAPADMGAASRGVAEPIDAEFTEMEPTDTAPEPPVEPEPPLESPGGSEAVVSDTPEDFESFQQQLQADESLFGATDV